MGSVHGSAFLPLASQWLTGHFQSSGGQVETPVLCKGRLCQRLPPHSRVLRQEENVLLVYRTAELADCNGKLEFGQNITTAVPLQKREGIA
jgi:hypothetical protein